MTNLEKLDTLPELQKALEQEREARQRTDSDLYDLRAKLEDYMRADKALTARAEQAEGQQRSDFAKMQAWRERAEQAERERDEADKRTLEMCAVQEAEMQARIRAEADNAALLDLLECREEGGDTDAEADAWADRVLVALTEPHPGAALLERVRALEEIASEDHRSPVDGNGAGYGGAFAEGWKARGLHIRRIVGTMKSQPAPAAPAEHVRALEAVREMAEPFRAAVALNLRVHRGPVHTRMPVSVTTGQGTALLDACAAADALKGKR